MVSGGKGLIKEPNMTIQKGHRRFGFITNSGSHACGIQGGA
jgi:hypothetical protein